MTEAVEVPFERLRTGMRVRVTQTFPDGSERVYEGHVTEASAKWLRLRPFGAGKRDPDQIVPQTIRCEERFYRLRGGSR